MRRFCWLGIALIAVVLVPRGVLGEDEQVFVGVLHSHTSYSDGSGTPEQAYRRARDVARCDFFAITEHNHKRAEDGAKDRKDGRMIATDHSLYEGPQKSAIIPTAERFTKEGHFVAFYGQEFSTIGKGNHVNVFEVPKVIDVTDGAFDLLLDWIRANPDSSKQSAIIQFNHPGENAKDPKREREYGADDFGSQSEWIKRMGECACMIEILNGPAMSKTDGQCPNGLMEKDYLRYLSLGFHPAPTAGQDNHYATWGTLTDARTGVIADELTKPKLLAAIRARHVYATEDKDLKVVVKVNGHLCGDRVSPPQRSTALRIEYRIDDEDEPDADYEVEVFAGRIGGTPAEVAHAFTVAGNTPAGKWGQNDELTYTGESDYYFFKITQASEDDEGDHAWTSPVWFEAGAAACAAEPTSPDLSQAVASKNSPIYHVSKECCAARQIKEENLLKGEDATKGRRAHANCPMK